MRLPPYIFILCFAAFGKQPVDKGFQLFKGAPGVNFIQRFDQQRGGGIVQAVLAPGS